MQTADSQLTAERPAAERPAVERRSVERPTAGQALSGQALADQPPADQPPVDRLRSDARDNRDRILVTAREVFASRGLDAPMTTIARRAGVGVATLYRRFPTKGALVSAAFADTLCECAELVDHALELPDPWDGFCWLLEQVCLKQAEDRGFTAAFLRMFPDAVDDAARDRALERFAGLVERAKAGGRLRADFEMHDLTMALMANSGLVTDSREAAEAASRRLVSYLIQGFAARDPLPPATPLGLEHVVPYGT